MRAQDGKLEIYLECNMDYSNRNLQAVVYTFDLMCTVQAHKVIAPEC